jgi:hypothetical protein
MKFKVMLIAIALALPTAALAQSPNCNPYVQSGDDPCSFTSPAPAAPAGAVGWLQPYPNEPAIWVPPYDIQKVDELKVGVGDHACVWLVLENDDPARYQTVNVVFRFQSAANRAPIQLFIGLKPNERKDLSLHEGVVPVGVYFSVLAYLPASGSIHASHSDCVNDSTVVSAHAQK